MLPYFSLPPAVNPTRPAGRLAYGTAREVAGLKKAAALS